MFWEWLSINSWIFWLPALAIAIATVLILRKHRSRDLRSKVTLKSIPRWAILVMIPVVIATIALLGDSLVLRLIREFFVPSGYSSDWLRIPIYSQTIIFSLIGIPIILQGLAFGWLRRLFTSAVHCPKCNYDLASLIKHHGQANTICPECGFTPSSDQPIGRPKKRRRLILIGSLIILIGLSLSGYRYWLENGRRVPAWFSSVYTTLTGTLDLWQYNPQLLGKRTSVRVFNAYFQPVGNPPALPPAANAHLTALAAMTRSRDLDRVLDSTLAQIPLQEQITLLYWLRRVIFDSRTSATRVKDLSSSRLPLDDLLDTYLDDQGQLRRNLDYEALLALYRDPATPTLTKAFITLSLQAAPLKQSMKFFPAAADATMRRWLLFFAMQATSTRPESYLDEFHEAGIDDATLRLLVDDLFADDQSQLGIIYYVRFESNVEYRVLTILESDASPLFQVPTRYAAYADGDKLWYRSMASYMSVAFNNSTSPLARARWQALINELNHLANQAAPPPAPANPTPATNSTPTPSP